MSVDSQILTALRKASAASVSGAELASRLGISRAAIWARIEELRALGYDISASPHGGYHLKGTPNALHSDDLLSRLGPVEVVGRDIQVFQETSSTNDVIEKMAQDGVPEGMVVFAEKQTKGRGRLGRAWSSPSGKGLWFSVLLRPQTHPQAVTRLTIASATAVARAVELSTGIRPEIKWPNDLLIHGKKFVGILTELNAEVDKVRYVILGIGVDVNLDPADFPAAVSPIATSLKIASGRTIDRPALAAVILKALDEDYAHIRADRFERVSDAWESQCSTLGNNVSIRMGEHLVHGRAESLDPDGALLVRTEHGRLERVMGGDVSIEK